MNLPTPIQSTMSHLRDLLREHPDFRGLHNGGQVKITPKTDGESYMLQVQFRTDGEIFAPKFVGEVPLVRMVRLAAEDGDLPINGLVKPAIRLKTTPGILDIGFVIGKDQLIELNNDNPDRRNDMTKAALQMPDTATDTPKRGRGRPRRADWPECDMTEDQIRMVSNWNKSNKDVKIKKMADEEIFNPRWGTHRVLQDGKEIGRLARREKSMFEISFMPVWRKTRGKFFKTVKDGIAFLHETTDRVGSEAEPREWRFLVR